MIQNKKPLINDDSTIYIPMEIDNIIKETYDETSILKYVNFESKYYVGSSNWFYFEFVRDLGDPANDWLPFIYHNWI